MKNLIKFLKKDVFMFAGFFILLNVVFIAVLGPFIFKTDPNSISFVFEPLAPSFKNFFGTDDLGRDILIRIIYGARVSLLVAFISMAISLSIGTFLGLVSGFYKGIIDEIIMRFIDLFMSVPTIFLLLTIQVILKPSIYNVMIIIGLTGWMGVARIVRSEVLSVSGRDYIKNARSHGFSNVLIMFKYILPNVAGPLFVMAILGMAGAIMTESALSYFGLGVQPPHASWGNMLYNAQQYITDAWWMTFFPGFFIFVTVLSLNFVGEGFYKIISPKE